MMRNPTAAVTRNQAGVVLLEVLVTILIVAFGLLGLAGLETKIQMAEVDALQRGQALWALEDMASRMVTEMAAKDPPDATDYLTTSAGTDEITTCAGTGATRDLCEWNNLLRGGTETSGGARLGAMINARGCIVELQKPSNTAGACKAGIYRIDVVWQGMTETLAPAIECGKDGYGADGYRRAISQVVTLGVPNCLNS